MRIFIPAIDISENIFYIYNNIDGTNTYCLPLDMVDWCKGNHIKYKKINSTFLKETGLLFETEEDAMAFKLRWFD